MARGWNTVLALTGLAVLVAIPSAALAQDTMQSDSMQKDSSMKDGMKQDSMKHGDMKHDDMAPDKNAKALFTGTFHKQVHGTTGRATIYQTADGKKILRLTHFKTSNGPDVHVILIAAKDSKDNSLSGNLERIELGKLKGNEGDQNYELPENIDWAKFQAVSIYCERFDANFGVAPLVKF